MKRLASILAAIGLVSGLSACGTLQRPALTNRAAPLSAAFKSDVRVRPSDQQTLDSFSRDMSATLRAGAPRLLALSGGGANGAFGAGLLVGWSEHGNRPVFDVVTGVSTGALAAPFAFLGADWDDELEHAYTSGRTAKLVALDNIAALVQPAFFSVRPLRELVDENVTPDLLAAIAAEHRKGRRLLVATTDLDREETVIWDMGEIASQGDEAARDLFKEILIASASIPGVFPPVLIAGEEKGKPVYAMHVDGGVNTPFLAIPDELMDWTRDDQTGAAGGEIFVIVNGVAERRVQDTPGTLGAILSRTFDSMSKASLRRDLMLTRAFAQRNGLALHVASIPEAWPSSGLDFTPSAMRELFERGKALGRDAPFEDGR